MKGRVASLLEVGTGFHPELTGRENIYLNGTILGMTRAEVRRKFDEIVAFAELDKFIDTPVKRYSSGMYVRLAFAVATHLDPEILLVDEVLAVGDAEFQKKCLGKMKDVAGQGRTVLFVSHSMSAIQQLCPQSIVFSGGELMYGPAASRDAVHAYLGRGRAPSHASVQFHREAFHLHDVRITAVDGSLATPPVPHDEPHCVEVTFALDRYDPAFRIGFELFGQDGDVLFTSMSSDAGPEQSPRMHAGMNRLRAVLPAYGLNEGDYQIGVIAYYHGAYCLLNPHRDDVRLPFSVRVGPGLSPEWNRKRIGPMAPLLRWEGGDVGGGGPSAGVGRGANP
jgi:lipopolysaccharide transport system ATP-binding protein